MLLIIRYILLAILLPAALASDIKTYKIKNLVVFPFIFCGIATNSVIDGITGLFASLLGIAAPVVLLLILFALRMLGAGDIKLFCAVGAIMGMEFVLYTIAYSFLSGAIIAIIIIAAKRNGRQRIIHLYRYLKGCLLTLSLLPYTDFQDKSDGSKFHFSLAIAFGTAINIITIYCGQ